MNSKINPEKFAKDVAELFKEKSEYFDDAIAFHTRSEGWVESEIVHFTRNKYKIERVKGQYKKENFRPDIWYKNDTLLEIKCLSLHSNGQSSLKDYIRKLEKIDVEKKLIKRIENIWLLWVIFPIEELEKQKEVYESFIKNPSFNHTDIENSKFKTPCGKEVGVVIFWKNNKHQSET